VERAGHIPPRIALLGVTFKPGSDDIRLSPSLELVKQLPRAYQIVAFDRDLIHGPSLSGVNQEQLNQILSQYALEMQTQPADLLASSKVVVLAKPGVLTTDELRAWLTPD